MSLNAKYDNAGKLDERITIQTYTEAADSTGDMVKTWAAHHSCWAERVGRGGMERYEADQLTAVNKVLWRIRYKSTVTEKMRVKDRNSEYYYIDAITIEGRDQWMILTTEKRD